MQRKRFRVVPEVKYYEIEVPNRFRETPEDPETVTLNLTGYIKGPGCPGPVTIEVDEALAQAEESEPEDPGEGKRTMRYLASYNAAERMLRRDLLCAVLYDEKGNSLDPEDANFLAAEGAPWHEILSELGWWITPSSDNSEDAEGEVTGENE